MKESANLRVMKFGGTSVGDAACIKRAAQIVFEAGEETSVVMVVSAMSGVTNRLIEVARKSATGDETVAFQLASTLHEQHKSALESLVEDVSLRRQISVELDEIIERAAGLCRGTALLQELTPRALDVISSTGERLSARIVAGALCELGARAVAVDATELIVTDDAHGQAEPLMQETRERATANLLPLIADGVIPIVTGFIGATRAGVLTTLGRGGSDYSATILGAALDASEIVIWTDVDGVLTADPRLVNDARTLREISYAEAAELAHFGAKVLHPKTLRPIEAAGVSVWIRNSFAPENHGTKITPRGNINAANSRRGVRAVTAIGGVSLITVGGRGIVDTIGIAAKTFMSAARARANVLFISQASSQNDICFVVNTRDAHATLENLKRAFAHDIESQNVEHITVNHDIAIIAAVGERMRGATGLAGKLFDAVGREGININAIAQGSSEHNVSFIVEAKEMKRAVAAVHREFELERPSEP